VNAIHILIDCELISSYELELRYRNKNEIQNLDKYS